MQFITQTLIATTLSAAAFAATPAQKAPAKPMAPAAVPAPAMTDPNPTARFGTKDSSNVFVTGEAIWFKPLTNTVACSNDTAVNSTTDQTSVTMFKSKFQPGVRVSLGYNTSYDGWDAVLIYTGLRYKHNNSFRWSSTIGDAFNYTGSLSNIYSYDLGDFDLGRMFKVSKHLKLRPHTGVRALWLTQKNEASYLDTLGGDSYNQTAKLKGTLVGLEAGLDSIWMLSKEFSIYANVGVGSLVNQQKAIASTSDITTPTTNRAISNYGVKIVNALDIALGLRWDRNFSNDDYHFSLNLGYEQHSLININSQANFNVTNLYSSPDNGLFTDTDFTLQGIALGARFDF